MGWESDQEAVEIKTDRSRWIILGVVGMVIAMIVTMVIVNSNGERHMSRVRVSHILRAAPQDDEAARQVAYDEIVLIKQYLSEGADFAELAKEHSQDQATNNNGGDLGWAERGELVEEFDEYIWVGEVGSISQPIETPYGWHVVRIDQREISEAELYDKSLNERAFERNKK